MKALLSVRGDPDGVEYLLRALRDTDTAGDGSVATFNHVEAFLPDLVHDPEGVPVRLEMGCDTPLVVVSQHGYDAGYDPRLIALADEYKYRLINLIVD